MGSLGTLPSEFFLRCCAKQFKKLQGAGVGAAAVAVVVPAVPAAAAAAAAAPRAAAGDDHD